MDAVALKQAVFISVQRSLLGEITPEMRAISVDLSPNRVTVYVYHDGPVDQDLVDDFDACVITQMVADFPYPERGDPIIGLEFLRFDWPKRVEPRGSFVYHRKEDTTIADNAA